MLKYAKEMNLSKEELEKYLATRGPVVNGEFAKVATTLSAAEKARIDNGHS
jgi:hypothetical protein